MEAQTPQQSVIDLPNDVDRVLRDYGSAWAARDAEALANLFTPDGFVLRPGSPLVRGRDAILDGVPGLWRPAGPEAVWLNELPGSADSTR
jgi:ketosteroid isomerase-like protein